MKIKELLLNNPFILKFQEKLGADAPKAIGAILFFLVIASYLDFNYVINAQIKGIKDIGPKIVKMRGDLKTLEKDLKKMQDLQKKKAGTQQEAARHMKKFTREQDLPVLLKNISDLANKYGIRVSQIKPSKETRQKNVKDQPKVDVLLINLDLTGGYHAIGRFINDLENAEDFIAVQQLTIAALPQDVMKQQVNLVLKTYVKK